jgi:CRP-like cAMP-binding protein
MDALAQSPLLVGHIRICDTDPMSDEQLASALRAYKRAEKALTDRRNELFEIIGEAVVERGVKQADAARQTGYTREHIRRICNAYIEKRDGKTDVLKIAR